MAKQSKRQRKFESSGGVKGRLQKGTITKKGKLQKRKRDDAAKSSNNKQPLERDDSRDRSDDFLHEKQLGDLDMDDFFAQATEVLEHPDDASDGDEELEEKKEIKETKVNEKKSKQQKVPKEVESSSSESSDESESSSSEEQAPPSKKKKATKSKTKSGKKTKQSSDSESDSEDDDDIEAAEERMKAEMANLTKADPEFHDFLQENEQSLLEFGQDEEDEEEEEDSTPSKKTGSPSSVLLTPQELKKMEAGVFQQLGLKHLKRLITAYRSACHLADSSEDRKSRPGESGIQFIIDSSTVFDRLMVTCLSRCHDVFHHHLFPDESREDPEEGGEEGKEASDTKTIPAYKMERSERWSDMKNILKSFFSSTLHILSEAKEPELLTFILKALSKYMVFLSAFPRVAEAMLKSFVDKWSAPLDSSEDYHAVRINAFFRIRQLAITQPFPFIETCLRKTYLAYARRSKHGKTAPTVEVLSTLTFMGNSVVELYNLDLHSSYQHAFVYIRQLALHLRSAVQKTSQESLQQLFRWQYMHCLKVWVAVLSNIVSQDDGTQMRSLIYPLTEIINGLARIAPANLRFLPLRLHCVRLLQQLAASSEMYIPTTALLLDALEWKEWYLKPKKTGKKNSTSGLNMIQLLKLPKEDSLRTHEQLETGITEIFVLLEREVDLYMYTAGFPEFSIWIRRRLRAFIRENRQPRWRSFASGIVDLCDKHAASAVSGRAKLSEAPKDVQHLECLRPPSTPNMKERYQTAIDKEAKRMVATTPASAKASTDAVSKDLGNDDDDEEMSESEAPKNNKKKTKMDKKKNAKQKDKKLRPPSKPMVEDPTALEQEDDVREGINWSDDEED